MTTLDEGVEPKDEGLVLDDLGLAQEDVGLGLRGAGLSNCKIGDSMGSEAVGNLKEAAETGDLNW